MEKRTKQLIIHWSIRTGGLITLFWTVWYLVIGEVPTITSIKMTESWIYVLPFGISRWSDILIGPIWSTIIILLLTGKRLKNNKDLVAGLVAGLIVGLLYGLVFGLGTGLGICLCVGLGVGLVVKLATELIAGPNVELVCGLVVKLGAGLGFGLGVGFVYGLVAGLIFELVYELGSGLGIGLVFLFRLFNKTRTKISNWLLVK